MKRKLFLTIELVAAVLIVAVYFFVIKSAPPRLNYYKVLCMGDSLTESSYGQYTRNLKRLFKAGGFKVNVYPAARPGNTSGQYLEYLRKSNILAKINPHILVLMLGSNDVRIDGDNTPLPRFEKNMREIIKIIKSSKNPATSKKIVFIATIPPIFNCDLPTFDETSQRRVKEEIVPAVKKLAKEEELYLIDVFDFFRDKPGLLPGIHPTKEGYRALAEFIFKEIRPFVKGSEK
ncbi:MAG: SGNH/GDSL hydrolase family protein [Candidatus Aminicenantes bacterium]|nr:SGNH/GDSL hydrolase family protein [Candidatus Aminicenantes bacterium]